MYNLVIIFPAHLRNFREATHMWVVCAVWAECPNLVIRNLARDSWHLDCSVTELRCRPIRQASFQYQAPEGQAGASANLLMRSGTVLPVVGALPFADEAVQSKQDQNSLLAGYPFGIATFASGVSPNGIGVATPL